MAFKMSNKWPTEVLVSFSDDEEGLPTGSDKKPVMSGLRAPQRMVNKQAEEIRKDPRFLRWMNRAQSKKSVKAIIMTNMIIKYNGLENVPDFMRTLFGEILDEKKKEN